jgi:hypothetical protein
VSDTLLGATITAIATITGGGIFALIQYRARRPLLRATVYVNDIISLPTFLQNYLRQLLQAGQAPGVTPGASDRLAVLAGLRCYVHLTLQNRGRAKISALTLTVTDRTSQYVFQVDRQVDPLRQQDGQVVLGDLQPRQKLVLHIWSDRVIGAFVTELFHLTADNLYKQTWRAPFPTYLHFKFQKYGFISFVVLILLLVLSPLYIPYLPFLPTCSYP